MSDNIPPFKDHVGEYIINALMILLVLVVLGLCFSVFYFCY